MSLPRHNDWAISHYSSESLRALAGKWDALAIAAEADGDQWYAAEATAEARHCRQRAREIEIQARP